MRLLHLTASTFFGGPERQMLSLAAAMPGEVETTFASFAEGGRSTAFIDEARDRGFTATTLANDFPRVLTTLRELTALLRDSRCHVLFCHGYKANLLGRIAARRAGVPAVAVSRGWTGETRKVKFYEWLDRRHLRYMDRVVCVSEGQAAKARRWCRVPDERLTVIRNSARLDAFASPPPAARTRLLRFFPKGSAVSRVVLAAGRLSPEKGFDVLVEAAATICRGDRAAGIVLFGDGAMRQQLQARVAELGLAGRFILPGFRGDLDMLIGAADVVVLPSYTEGLPNVALEAAAAGVPVVATAVGGTPEVVLDGETGFLVPPGDPRAIAARVRELLDDPLLRAQFGAAGRDYMQSTFTFEAQAAAYHELSHSLLNTATTGAGFPLRVAGKPG